MRRFATRSWISIGLLSVAVLTSSLLLSRGVSEPPPRPALQEQPKPADSGTEVRVAHPKKQTLRHRVEQPGTLDAFQQTPIYAKISGFVELVNKDIGDP